MAVLMLASDDESDHQNGTPYYSTIRNGNTLLIASGVWHEKDEDDIEYETQNQEFETIQAAVRAHADFIIKMLDAGYTEVLDDEDEDEDEDEEEDREIDDLDIDTYETVQSVSEIREQLESFNKALQEPSVRQKWIGQMLRSSKYWVYDSQSGNFGLNKLVAYYPVDPVQYTYRSVEAIGPWMNGGSAKIAIEKVTGTTYTQSHDVLKLFKEWVGEKLAPGAEDDLNYNAIKFVTI